MEGLQAVQYSAAELRMHAYACDCPLTNLHHQAIRSIWVIDSLIEARISCSKLPVPVI